MDDATRSLDRHTRRRLRTRTELLRAALRLFGERHPDDVSVQDITRLADVGSGSFYNHFVSKPAVYDSVVDELVEGWVVWIRRATGETSDPALRLSHRLRGSLERSRRDPDFARFVARNGLFLVERQTRAEASLYDDIDRGLSAGRFAVADPQMAKRAVTGVVLATHNAFALGRDEPMASTRAVWYVLTLLGIAREEADRLVSLSLPQGEPDDFALIEQHYLRTLEAGLSISS